MVHEWRNGTGNCWPLVGKREKSKEQKKRKNAASTARTAQHKHSTAQHSSATAQLPVAPSDAAPHSGEPEREPKREPKSATAEAR